MPDPASTPLIEVDGIFAKIECVHPAGSVKDRIAQYILRSAEDSGQLRPGMRIVEATSGNTGIAVAYYGKRMGYAVTIVMPEHMTEERKALIRGLGAELILVSKEGSFAEAVEVRDRIAQDPDVYCVDQFANPLNVECHERTTGAEILLYLKGRRPDAFVAGVGTGGTLMGIGRAFRQANPEVWLAAVEPAEAAVMTGGPNGPHGIFGIGDGFLPPIVLGDDGALHPMIDEAIVVSTDEAMTAATDLRERFNLCVGVSSGANFAAAQRLKGVHDTVVTVFADGYSKYSSHGLRRCEPGACPFEALCPEPIPARTGIN
ncbi:MAG TPA: cysteine synthase family protein [Fimbriimonadaceae bacterium]|nr:cysteine synthase family protein [Fimbriimonadaceae bacterium]